MISAHEFPVLFSKNEIDKMIRELAERVDRAYPNKVEDLVCVGILKGAFLLLSDLVKHVQRPVLVDFVRAVSYGQATESSGTVRILKDIEMDVKGRHVLLVDEMIDTGRTLAFLKERFRSSDAASVKTLALLDKKQSRQVPIEADFVGALCPDEFVVGYGLDWGERYRDLKDIRSVPARFYQKS